MPDIITLPCRDDMVGTARYAVRNLLAATPIGEDAELVVSELMTNAVLWSRSGLPDGTIEIRVYRDPDSTTARLEVVDAGPLPVRPVHGDEDDPGSVLLMHGRGLDIVREVSAKCGQHGSRTVQTWWAEWSW